MSSAATSEPYGDLRPEDGWVEINGAAVTNFADHKTIGLDRLAEVAAISPDRLLGIGEAFDRAFTVAEIDRIAAALGIAEPRAVSRVPAHYETALLQLADPDPRQALMAARLRSGKTWRQIVKELRPHPVTATAAEQWDQLGGSGPPADIAARLAEILGLDPADTAARTLGPERPSGSAAAGHDLAGVHARAVALVAVAGIDADVWVAPGPQLLLVTTDPAVHGVARLISHQLGVHASVATPAGT